MKQKVTQVEEIVDIQDLRLKSTERDCPNCDAVLVLNENEQCYECVNCGYIDCGDEGLDLQWSRSAS